MSYVIANTSNPLGRRPWVSRLQMSEYLPSGFQIPTVGARFPRGRKEYRNANFLLPTITPFAGTATGYENASFIIPTTGNSLGDDAGDPAAIAVPSGIAVDPMWLLIGAGVLAFLSFSGGLKTAPALQAHRIKRVSRKRAKLQRQLRELGA